LTYDGEQCYEHFVSLGLAYGPQLRVIESVRVDDTGVLAALQPGQENSVAVVLDAALQSLIGFGIEQDRLLLPFAIDQVEIDGRLDSTRWIYAEQTSAAEHS